MARTHSRCLPLLVLFAAGCLWDEPRQTTLVPGNPLGNAPFVQRPVQTSFAPASLEAATRVDALGRKILAANPQIGDKPLFCTIGAPHPEVFHKGTTEVVLTEGLVQQCQTEGQLAAVLCQELGKMVSEREALAGPRARSPERQPPPEVRIGTDSMGLAGAPDQTRLAELARYDRPRSRGGAPAPLPPPDPAKLAAGYLGNAGFAESDLEAAAPLLKAAAENSAFSRQLAPPQPTRPWTK